MKDLQKDAKNSNSGNKLNKLNSQEVFKSQ